MLINKIADNVKGFEIDFTDVEPVIEKIGNARVILIGESSHGTYEFYKMRAEITKRLITEKKFIEQLNEMPGNAFMFIQ